MKSFIDRFSNLVKGTIPGFDRIVFKRLVLPLMFNQSGDDFLPI